MAVSGPYYCVGGPAQLVQSTTPPTAQQAAQVQKIVAIVGMGTADTQALITHNWGLGAGAPAQLDPEIIGPIWLTGPVGGGTQAPSITFDVTNTNVVKANKLGVAGTDGYFYVILRRPFSMGQ